jgi:thymidylate kinase
VPSGFVTGSFTKILRNSTDRVQDEVFALAYAADHLFHYNHYIKKLEENSQKFVVIQERSLLSTYIYQGLVGDIKMEWLKEINKFDKNIPKLTLILKVPAEEIMKRKALENRQFDKFEDTQHLKKQVDSYYNLSPELAKQFNVEYIDAVGAPVTIAERCAQRIQKEIEKFY